MISPERQKEVSNAIKEVEAFLLQHKERAKQAGRMQNWDRDWSIFQAAQAVIARSDPNEIKRFLDVEFRGLSHHFAVYCEDDAAVGIILDRLYFALTEALQSRSPVAPSPAINAGLADGQFPGNNCDLERE